MDRGQSRRTWSASVDVAGKRIVFREATPADYNKVMSMSTDVYSGWDYLPSWYYPLLHRPNTRIHVAEYGDTIVSLLLSIIDEEVLYQGSARTHPAYAKQGIMSALAKILTEHQGPLLQEFPNINTICCIAFDSRYSNINVHQLGQLPCAMQWRVRAFDTSTQRLSLHLTQLKVKIPGVSLQKDSAIKTLEQHSRTLFPEGFFISTALFLPLIPNKDNFAKAYTLTDMLFFYGDEECFDGVLMVEASMVPNGTMLHTFCYMRRPSNVSSLLNDMFLAVAEKASHVASPCKPVSVMMHFPEHCPPQSLLDFVQRHQLADVSTASAIEPYKATLYWGDFNFNTHCSEVKP